MGCLPHLSCGLAHDLSCGMCGGLREYDVMPTSLDLISRSMTVSFDRSLVRNANHGKGLLPSGYEVIRWSTGSTCSRARGIETSKKSEWHRNSATPR